MADLNTSVQEALAVVSERVKQQHPEYDFLWAMMPVAAEQMRQLSEEQIKELNKQASLAFANAAEKYLKEAKDDPRFKPKQ